MSSKEINEMKIVSVDDINEIGKSSKKEYYSIEPSNYKKGDPVIYLATDNFEEEEGNNKGKDGVNFVIKKQMQTPPSRKKEEIYKESRKITTKFIQSDYDLNEDERSFNNNMSNNTFMNDSLNAYSEAIDRSGIDMNINTSKISDDTFMGTFKNKKRKEKIEKALKLYNKYKSTGGIFRRKNISSNINYQEKNYNELSNNNNSFTCSDSNFMFSKYNIGAIIPEEPFNSKKGNKDYLNIISEKNKSKESSKDLSKDSSKLIYIKNKIKDTSNINNKNNKNKSKGYYVRKVVREEHYYVDDKGNEQLLEITQSVLDNNEKKNDVSESNMHIKEEIENSTGTLNNTPYIDNEKRENVFTDIKIENITENEIKNGGISNSPTFGKYEPKVLGKAERIAALNEFESDSNIYIKKDNKPKYNYNNDAEIKAIINKYKPQLKENEKAEKELQEEKEKEEKDVQEIEKIVNIEFASKQTENEKLPEKRYENEIDNFISYNKINTNINTNTNTNYNTNVYTENYLTRVINNDDNKFSNKNSIDFNPANNISNNNEEDSFVNMAEPKIRIKEQKKETIKRRIVNTNRIDVENRSYIRSEPNDSFLSQYQNDRQTSKNKNKIPLPRKKIIVHKAYEKNNNSVVLPKENNMKFLATEENRNSRNSHVRNEQSPIQNNHVFYSGSKERSYNEFSFYRGQKTQEKNKPSFLQSQRTNLLRKENLNSHSSTKQLMNREKYLNSNKKSNISYQRRELSVNRVKNLLGERTKIEEPVKGLISNYSDYNQNKIRIKTPNLNHTYHEIKGTTTVRTGALSKPKSTKETIIRSTNAQTNCKKKLVYDFCPNTEHECDIRSKSKNHNYYESSRNYVKESKVVDNSKSKRVNININNINNTNNINNINNINSLRGEEKQEIYTESNHTRSHGFTENNEIESTGIQNYYAIHKNALSNNSSNYSRLSSNENNIYNSNENYNNYYDYSNVIRNNKEVTNIIYENKKEPVQTIFHVQTRAIKRVTQSEKEKDFPIKVSKTVRIGNQSTMNYCTCNSLTQNNDNIIIKSRVKEYREETSPFKNINVDKL